MGLISEKFNVMNRIQKVIILFLILRIPLIAIHGQINNPNNIAYDWKTDTANRIIALSEIMVAVPRNTFPTIDYPKFIGKEEGLKRFFQHEPVISVEINGLAKAYPLNMLTMHEISNDSLGGLPILTTYCPLCNSSVVYDRRQVYNEVSYTLDFEVSGMLRNSDMIMADKQTETWWQQLMGKGLVGKLAGAELTVLPSFVISVRDFFSSYPNGEILSPDTGTSAQNWYGKNPYEGYDHLSNKPYARFFDHKKLDSRVRPMERVIDLQGSNGYRVYPFSTISEKGVINDQYDGMHIVIFYKKGMVSVLDKKDIRKSKSIGSATMFSSLLDEMVLTFKKRKDLFIDDQTNSTWDITGQCIRGALKGRTLMPKVHSNHFAFAWMMFHPESEIYGH